MIVCATRFAQVLVGSLVLALFGAVLDLFPAPGLLGTLLLVGSLGVVAGSIWAGAGLLQEDARFYAARALAAIFIVPIAAAIIWLVSINVGIQFIRLLSFWFAA
jgi:hypothetical protein